MRRARVMMIAAAAALAAGAADAADLPPVFYKGPPVPIEEFGGWYLRGDIGMTNQRLKNIHDVQMDTAVNFRWLDKGGFDSGWLFGLGFGYEVNRWLRADATGEYRGKTAFHALDAYGPIGGSPPAAGSNEYTARKSEWLFLANAYVDLGTWWHLTPFVGAGVGFSRVTISDYRDHNPISNQLAYGPEASKWNFAWALHAGVAYKVTPGFTMELSYRYVSLGDGTTRDVVLWNGVSNIYNPVAFNNIASHDIKLGMRWMLMDMPVYAPPPLVTKG